MKIKWKLILFFLISVIVSLVLEKIITPDNFAKSPMYWLLPIVGFFGMYYISEPVMEYMKIKNKYWFTAIFVGIALVAFYIMLFIYFWNVQYILSQQSIHYPFIKLLIQSAYLEFIIGILFGGIAID